jgi:hypothetical protein
MRAQADFTEAIILLRPGKEFFLKSLQGASEILADMESPLP